MVDGLVVKAVSVAIEASVWGGDVGKRSPTGKHVILR